jgi:hypothetical protein
MRIFIGSSGEQKRLVEWLAAFMRSEYAGKLEPVPWTLPWPGGKYTLENLLNFVNETDAAILFWTADDKTWYRDTRRFEPRDNLVFEGGLFVAAHGLERTQLMIPSYGADDPRGTVATPSDLAGLTWNVYAWADGQPESTGLPRTARLVCDQLAELKPRPRRTTSLPQLVKEEGVEEVRTIVGEWATIHVQGIAKLAARSDAVSIDVLAVYRIGEIRRVLDPFKRRKGAQLRVCFANVWDEKLAEAYQRKFYDRTAEHMQAAVKESIQGILGPCDVRAIEPNRVVVNEVKEPPVATYEIKLTDQRITYGFYRVDDVIFLVPLDMKKAQNPAPLAWVLEKETAPQTFKRYLEEFESMFQEAHGLYPS